MMFVASLVLLEKSEGTLQALRAAPLPTRTYLLSKVVSLTTFAIIESLVTYIVATRRIGPPKLFGWRSPEFTLGPSGHSAASLRPPCGSTHFGECSQEPCDGRTANVGQVFNLSIFNPAL